MGTQTLWHRKTTTQSHKEEFQGTQPPTVYLINWTTFIFPGLNISRHFGILGQVQSFVPELVLFWTNSRMLLRKCDLIFLCLQEGCLCHPSFISLNLDHPRPPPLLLPIHHFCPHTFLHLHQDLRLGELYCIEVSDLLKQFFTHIFAPSLECTTLHKTYLCWETILGNDLQVQPLERHLQVWQ